MTTLRSAHVGPGPRTAHHYKYFSSNIPKSKVVNADQLKTIQNRFAFNNEQVADDICALASDQMVKAALINPLLRRFEYGIPNQFMRLAHFDHDCVIKLFRLKMTNLGYTVRPKHHGSNIMVISWK